MSKLQYWPSTMATEDLLTAHADLGDGNSVLELIQESISKSDSLLSRPVFSPRFLADLYTRLALAPQFESNEQAATKVRSVCKENLCFPFIKKLSAFVNYDCGGTERLEYDCCCFWCLKLTLPYTTRSVCTPSLIEMCVSFKLWGQWVVYLEDGMMGSFLSKAYVKASILYVQIRSACYNVFPDACKYTIVDVTSCYAFKARRTCYPPIS